MLILLLAIPEKVDVKDAARKKNLSNFQFPIAHTHKDHFS